jgi:protein phosphatase
MPARLLQKAPGGDPRGARDPGEPQIAALSNIGASPRRTLLEDRSRAEIIQTAGGLKVALGIVADGIGGENAGERAAEITVSSVFEFCQKSTERNIPKLLQDALEEANRRVFVDARSSRRKLNMGSTAAVAAIAGGRLYVANVGDSRIYLVREQRAARLTIDHTWEEEVVRSGRLSTAEAARHPRREEIVRSIGFDQAIQVDLGIWLHGGSESASDAANAQGLALQAGDRVLICSDGLTKTRHDNAEAHYVEEGAIPSIVAGRAPEQAAEALVRRALAAKVDDNVSVVVLEMPGGKREPAPIRLHPAVGAGLALALIAAAAVLSLPRLLRSANPSSPSPTIPPLPSGVAFVSELGGEAEVETPGGAGRRLMAEEIVAAGDGVVLRTSGSGSYIRLGLADQSVLYIGPDSEAELAAIADGEQITETSIVIHWGIVVISAEPGVQRTVAVTAPSGAGGRLRGSVMGVIFDSLVPRIDVDCFVGPCEVFDPGSGRLPLTLTAGQHVSIGPDVSISAPDAARSALYSFAGFCGGLVPTPGIASVESAPTRTPLGPLFVPPTLRPSPTATRRPPPPPPTATPVPPTEEPTRTRRNPPDTEVPTSEALPPGG